jgi:hypothetical protein
MPAGKNKKKVRVSSGKAKPKPPGKSKAKRGKSGPLAIKAEATLSTGFGKFGLKFSKSSMQSLSGAPVEFARGRYPDSIRVIGRERLWQFAPSGVTGEGEVLLAKSINPLEIGAVLPRLATLFEKFVFTRFDVAYIPRAAFVNPDNAGELMIAFERDYDVGWAATDVIDPDEAYTWAQSHVFAPYDRVIAEFEKLDPKSEYYVHEPALADASQSRLSSQGQILFATNTSFDASTLGYGALYVSYEIELMTPHVDTLATVPGPAYVEPFRMQAKGYASTLAPTGSNPMRSTSGTGSYTLSASATALGCSMTVDWNSTTTSPTFTLAAGRTYMVWYNLFTSSNTTGFQKANWQITLSSADPQYTTNTGYTAATAAMVSFGSPMVYLSSGPTLSFSGLHCGAVVGVNSGVNSLVQVGMTLTLPTGCVDPTGSFPSTPTDVTLTIVELPNINVVRPRTRAELRALKRSQIALRAQSTDDDVHSIVSDCCPANLPGRN